MYGDFFLPIYESIVLLPGYTYAEFGTDMKEKQRKRTKQLFMNDDKHDGTEHSRLELRQNVNNIIRSNIITLYCATTLVYHSLYDRENGTGGTAQRWFQHSQQQHHIFIFLCICTKRFTPYTGVTVII